MILEAIFSSIGFKTKLFCCQALAMLNFLRLIERAIEINWGLSFWDWGTQIICSLLTLWLLFVFLTDELNQKHGVEDHISINKNSRFSWFLYLIFFPLTFVYPYVLTRTIKNNSQNFSSLQPYRASNHNFKLTNKYSSQWHSAHSIIIQYYAYL